MSELNLFDKYLFYEEDHSLKCDRYGEKWREFIGDKAVHGLFNKAVELKEQNEVMSGALEEIVDILRDIIDGLMDEKAIACIDIEPAKAALTKARGEL